MPQPRVRLLDEDPELAATLDRGDAEEARQVLTVPTVTVPVGEWDLSRIDTAGSNLGLIVLEGLLTVNIGLADRVAAQLAGPGDLVHTASAPDPFVPAEVTHVAVQRARLAVLDARFIAASRRWPALLLSLHERLRVQEHRMSVLAAIGKLRRVEDRVFALAWHLAERWGRVTREGVLLPLPLTHETIGRLVGAERPTVTLVLGELARSGDLTRRSDGALVLRPDSAQRLHPALDREPSRRTRRQDAEVQRPPIDLAAARPLVDSTLVRERMRVMRARVPEPDQQDALLTRARDLTQRSAQLRSRIAEERAARASGRGDG